MDLIELWTHEWFGPFELNFEHIVKTIFERFVGRLGVGSSREWHWWRRYRFPRQWTVETHDVSTGIALRRSQMLLCISTDIAPGRSQMLLSQEFYQENKVLFIVLPNSSRRQGNPKVLSFVSIISDLGLRIRVFISTHFISSLCLGFKEPDLIKDMNLKNI